MANLTRAVFGGNLPWSLVGMGMGMAIGILVIIVDHRQECCGSRLRFPVLAVALGIYLPLKLSAAIFVGGVLAALASRKQLDGTPEPSHRGLVFSAGLITGEALMGIMLAMPIALSGLWPNLASDPFVVFAAPPLGGWPGLVVMMLVAWLLYRQAVGSQDQGRNRTLPPPSRP